MKHHIVHGKDGSQQRFQLAGELLRDIIPNSHVKEGTKLDDFIIDETEDYCLHLISHGSKGELKFDKSYRTDQILKKMTTNTTPPKMIFIYACHSGDEDGTAKKFNSRLNIPVIGVGECDTISSDDGDGNPLPAGSPVAFMYSLLSSTPHESINAFIDRIEVPSDCHNPLEKGKVIPTKARVFGTLPDYYKVGTIFGKLNITDEDREWITDLNVYNFTDYA